VGPTRTNLSAAILIGGRASRMGGLRKDALTIGGQRIIDRQLAVLHEVVDTVFAVSSATVEPEAPLSVVRDQFPDHGALGGIYTAIVSSPTDRTVIVACDLPFLTAAFLTHMAGIAADLVMPRSTRGYEPLCAIYSRACADPIRRRLERRQLEASVFPEGVKVAEIAPEVLAAYDADGLLFVNVNTPHDYERAQQLFERHEHGLDKRSARRDRIMDELGS
jgi:molybdopterin-guanine dinucleotide biosynthesis protein A